MEVNQDTLVRILNSTTCPWTKGYIAGILDREDPTRNSIAKELIEGSEGKINAIKTLRANFNLGLKRAKDVVDHYNETGEIVFPSDYSETDETDIS